MGILRNAVMSAVVASTFIGDAEANTLSKGEITGFRGVFCQNEDAAKTLTTYFNSDLSKEVQVPCMVAQGVVRVLRHVETQREWNIFEVETPDEEKHYIVTKIPFKNKEIDILFEEGKNEQDNYEL